MITLNYKSEYKELLRLAGPIMLSNLGIVIVQFFDNLMVGRLGALPLAGVSFAGAVFMLAFLLLLGILIGLTPLVGEKYVQGKHKEIAALFQNSLFIYTITGIAASILLFCAIPLLYHLGQPVEVVDTAIPYYKYLVWSLIPYMMFGAFKQFLEGIGNTKVNMIIITVSNIINIFLNWVFIYGNLGFEAMGAAGAGFATLISRISMPILASAYFIYKQQVRQYLKYFKWKLFSIKNITKIFSVGIPISLQMFVEGLAYSFTGIMMGWIGTVEIAGNQIALTMSSMAFMIVIGISSATTIKISHEFGRKNKHGLKRTSTASYHLTILWNLFTALFFIIFRHEIAKIFSHDAEVIRVASYLLIFVGISQISDGLQVLTVGILRGIQDVKQIMIIAIISYIFVNIPVGYIMAFELGLGAAGLWLGFIFGLSVAAILLYVRLRKKIFTDRILNTKKQSKL